MKQQLCIGDVGAKLPGADRDARLMGDERVQALRLFYRQDNCKYVPCDLRMGEGYREIAWSEINWETAGERVTK